MEQVLKAFRDGQTHQGLNLPLDCGTKVLQLSGFPGLAAVDADLDLFDPFGRPTGLRENVRRLEQHRHAGRLCRPAPGPNCDQKP